MDTDMWTCRQSHTETWMTDTHMWTYRHKWTDTRHGHMQTYVYIPGHADTHMNTETLIQLHSHLDTDMEMDTHTLTAAK